MRFFAFLLFSILTSAASAQVVSSFNLYFDSNKHQLLENHLIELEGELSKLTNIPEAYTIRIIGHTDADGDMAFNEALSNRRAKAVASHFKTNGFLQKQTLISGKSYVAPVASNENEEGKRKNRRVEIVIEANRYTIGDKLGYQNKAIKYQFDATNGGDLMTNKGTVLRIPEHAFVDADGIPIDGEVDISYREFNDAVDFLASGIPMTLKQDGDFAFYNSAGMFEVGAEQDGKEVFLQEGKQIEVKMTLSQQPENLNFYEFDEEKGSWDELAKMTDDKGNALAVPGWTNPQASAVVSSTSNYIQNYCSKSSCQGYVDMVNDGLKFIEDGVQLVPKYAALRETNIARNENSRQLHLVYTELNGVKSQLGANRHSYRLSKRGGSARNSLFKLSPKGRQDNELEVMKGIYWQYDKKNGKIGKSHTRQTWTACELEKIDDKHFVIHLSNRATALELPVKPVFTRAKVSRRDRPAHLRTSYDSYRSAYDIYIANIQKLEKREKELETELAVLRRISFQLDSAQTGGIEQLNCFYQFNLQQSDNEAELAMNIEGWLAYFDKNNKKMRKRYEAEKNTNGMEYCIAQVAREEAIRDSIAKMYKKVNENRNNVMAAARSSMFIQNLGIFNADQVCKMTDPMNIIANYKNEEGEMVLPVSIFIVDSKVNGLIEYNGYMGYSPYKFVVRKSSKNAMFAVDFEGNIYKVAQKDFPTFNLSPKTGTVANFTFVLEEVKKNDTKQDLQADL